MSLMKKVDAWSSSAQNSVEKLLKPLGITLSRSPDEIPKVSIPSKKTASDRYRKCSFDTKKVWLRLQFQSTDPNAVKTPADLENEMREATKHDIDENTFDRIVGSLFGMATGDALGAHVEFRPHDYLADHPVTDLTGGGTWGLEKGQFTDDTSMALCLAASLIDRRDFNRYDQLVRYKWWYRHGYMSSTGQCFDIGAATRTSLEEFEKRQTGFAKKTGIPEDEMDYLSDTQFLNEFDVNCSTTGVAGNGSLMRLAPVPLFFFRHPPTAVDFAGQSGQVTHGDQKAIDACRYYAALIVAALHDESKDELLHDDFYTRHQEWFGDKELHVDIMNISQGSYKKRGGYDEGIRGGGYVVPALEAALWAFWSTSDFAAGALAAVNLGDDTDTTAAIYGQLAGAFYGRKNLPEKWIKELYAKKFIPNICGWISLEGHEWFSRQHKLIPYHRPASIGPSISDRATSAKPSKEILETELSKWTYDDVSEWIKSQQPNFIQYAMPIKRGRIDGIRILKAANGRIVELTKVMDDDRMLMERSLDDLRSSVSSEFYEQFCGDDFHVLAQIKLQGKINGERADGMMLRNKVTGWMGSLPRGTQTTGMDLLHSRGRYHAFLQRIFHLASKSRPKPHLMNMSSNKSCDQRVYEKICRRLEKYKRETRHKHYERVSIVRGWYGCSHTVMSEITQNGFTRPVKLGPGKNDEGFCLKSSAEAAAKDAGVMGCIIMCYMILPNPCPTLIDSRFRYYSNGTHSVHQEEPTNWELIKRFMSNPKKEKVEEGLYDEFVTNESGEIYPQVVIYLQPKEKTLLKYARGFLNFN